MTLSKPLARIAILATALALSGIGGPSLARYHGTRHHGPRSSWRAPAKHTGFFFRFQGGIGSIGLSMDDTSSGDINLRGAGGTAVFSIGGSVAPNLALHLDLIGATVFDPSVELDGIDQGQATGSELSMSAFGIGVTHHFAPSNIYLSATLGIGKSTITIDGDDFRSDSGLTLGLSLGKEWWVSKDWGLGVAGQLIYLGVPRQDIPDTTAPFLSYSLVFSATYN